MTEAALRSRLADIRCFVLDMDGTIYLGDRLFPFTKTFLEKAAGAGREVCFFTNNSSRCAADYVEKLARMEIAVPPERMLTSGQVAGAYLRREHPGQGVFLQGTPALRRELETLGVPLEEAHPQVVVLGFDTTLEYDRLRRTCDLVREGLPYLGVNPDLNCPVEGGFIPDCGSIARLIEASTGRTPLFLGKPSRETLRFLLERTGCREEELAVVGDRLYTDIALTQRTAALSILVMTGETTPEMLRHSEIQPTIIAASLEEIGTYL